MRLGPLRTDHNDAARIVFAVTPGIWHRGGKQGRRSAPVNAIMSVMVFFSLFAMAFGFVAAVCWMASIAWRKIKSSEEE